MKNKNRVYIFFYFSLINSIVIYHYSDFGGFYAIEQLVTSFDRGEDRFSLFLLFLNMSISVIFIHNIITKKKDFLILAEYILPKISRVRFMNLLLREVSKIIITLAGIKLIVDMLFCVWPDSSKIHWLFFLFFLYVTTFFIWGLIIIVLSLFKIDRGITLLITIIFIMIFQMISYNNKFASIFVVASTDYKENILFLLMSKIIMVLILLCCIRIEVNKYESYGGEKN